MELDKNKILIVDDEKAIRLGLAKCVRKAGYDPVEAADGSEALRLVEEHCPGLVVLDVMMRGLSGLEVCRILRQNPRTRPIKVVFLSARGQLKERTEGLEAGGDFYMTKPFEYRELIRVIRELLEVN
ncbi:MAG: hypothetical protein A3F83_15620 [Candidatus Glassbacteria bacterium RIFCSPLOWO2_12_FULL_58_11]|uniref:Response regulatory domain-containing protein n=1 Tax=Candidatus Glassbacteria bacterium RIFCSPLOWO2_12_FULL_58_11 TaxID=1817867 RepID=A0A1F5YMP5_9BACT|nr:MAG: hypothetical protein A3F83_15620 [Candidatus Glassbacteria bacterium RIFCSPLOWO2_12_FULL_58_11]